MMAENRRDDVSGARETLDTLLEMSKILNTGLDKETLSICLRLCESGVNPEALSIIIKELRRETAAVQSLARGSQSSQQAGE